MNDLHELLNWKLLKGSHKFPGPDGGTCINEAALVVAGFPYREVTGIGDLPKCFSRPLSTYALRLNDYMPDDMRQELLIPFVVRLAGTADTPNVERERANLIVTCTVSTVLPIVLRLHRLEDIARLCERVTTRHDASVAANIAREHLRAYAGAAAIAAAIAAADAAYVAAAADADAAAADADAARRQIWNAATAILDAALKIGRQAEPIETAVIIARAEKAKRELTPAE